MPKLPTEILEDAFYASGEKNFLLSRVFYRLLIGKGWDHALLGFSYMKLLDNVIDEDEDAVRARKRLDEQRKLMDAAYSGDGIGDQELPNPECFGWHVFLYDHSEESRLRKCFSDMLDTMEYDVDRRGKTSTKAELDDWALKVGGTTIRYLAHFVCPGIPLPEHFLNLASTAYLNADSIIDMEEDIEQGLINIPVEEIEAQGIKLDVADASMKAWMVSDSERIMKLFEEALAESKGIQSRTMRLLSWLYLSRKRRSLRRFLENRGLGICF